ncbi:olfactory receptor 10A3 [Etheostoma spectabile]|uniref:olfactory receptor 10A3 n=1 Tax=Etheostoma spectabile TaxID=54343 RepID=UPI0013AF743B|nr:olfactory receptor 10A3-like [Etheostoma spectabile]
MDNSTFPFYFNLTMFMNIGHYRYPVFVVGLLLYSFIVSANLILTLVICRERTLHEPMYIFIACLSVSSLYGSTGFFPRFLIDLLSDTHMISRPACFTQIYVIYTYTSYELTILGIMAHDRYVAVCHPLHYHRKMNSKTMITLAILAWILPVPVINTYIYLSSRLPLCGNEIHKVFCANWNIVKLSCVSTVVNNIVGMFFTIALFSLSLFYVLYTYLRIVVVCWKSSADFKGRVLNKCLPHVVSFVIYCIIGFSDIVLSRYNLEAMNPFVAIILSLEFVIIPPVVNPLVYGLKLPEIRRHILKLLQWFK